MLPSFMTFLVIYKVEKKGQMYNIHVSSSDCLTACWV